MSSARLLSATVSDPTRARMLQLILAEPDGRATVTRLAGLDRVAGALLTS